jgi:GTP cyclohydrolase II
MSSPLRIESEALIPTRHGELRFIVFRHAEDPSKEHVALVRGDPRGHDVLVRAHSECLTSEVFGSLRCDCAEQLDHAIALIAREGRGVIVYLRQEGRGIGLSDKIRAYALQERGLDTVDANRALDLPDDARRYDAAAAILRALGVGSVRLLTNNPAKVEALRALEIPVTERVPIVVPSHPLSHAYLATKQSRMRHALGVLSAGASRSA